VLVLPPRDAALDALVGGQLHLPLRCGHPEPGDELRLRPAALGTDTGELVHHRTPLLRRDLTMPL